MEKLGWNQHPFLVGGLEHFLFFHILGIIIPTSIPTSILFARFLKRQDGLVSKFVRPPAPRWLICLIQSFPNLIWIGPIPNIEQPTHGQHHIVDQTNKNKTHTCIRNYMHTIAYIQIQYTYVHCTYTHIYIDIFIFIYFYRIHIYSTHMYSIHTYSIHIYILYIYIHINTHRYIHYIALHYILHRIALGAAGLAWMPRTCRWGLTLPLLSRVGNLWFITTYVYLYTVAPICHSRWRWSWKPQLDGSPFRGWSGWYGLICGSGCQGNHHFGLPLLAKKGLSTVSTPSLAKWSQLTCAVSRNGRVFKGFPKLWTVEPTVVRACHHRRKLVAFNGM